MDMQAGGLMDSDGCWGAVGLWRELSGQVEGERAERQG
jgi:hypothetical protein